MESGKIRQNDLAPAEALVAAPASELLELAQTIPTTSSKAFHFGPVCVSPMEKLNPLAAFILPKPGIWG